MLYPLLQKKREEYRDKVVFQTKRQDSYVKYTYDEVLRHASAVAAHLRSLGVKPGDHVALWGESIPEWGIGYLGIHFCGAVATPLDAQLSAAVMVNLLQFCSAKVLICSENLLEDAHEIAAKIDLTILLLEPGEEPERIVNLPIDENFKPHPLQENDTMSLIFTSGTTGDPKGVMLSCENMVANALAVAKRGKLTPDDVLLCILPLHHCYAFTTVFLTGILTGAAITFQPVLQGPLIMAAMQETGVTIMAGVPQLFTMFDRAIWDKISAQGWIKRQVVKVLYRICHFFRVVFGWNLGKKLFKQIHERFGPRFRYFSSGGAKQDKEVAERFWNLGIPIVEGYGLSETSPVISMGTVAKFYPGSVGQAMPGVEVRIEKPNDEGVGEIVMRGSNLMKGYYKNEKATSKVIRDGWFYTGDLGYIDHRGFIYITGRAKEVIVLGSGKNVYPDEVEKAYEESPLIAEICVMGDASGGKGDRLTGLVVPDFDEIKRRKLSNIYKEIKFEIENIGLKLPSYMRLASLKIVSEPFPRTRLGKLKRKAIEKMQLKELSKDTKAPVAELTEEDRQLIAKPGGQALLQRIKGLADYDGEITPDQSLELDIGLDSIKSMELLAILEHEFGVKTTENTTFLSVRDILANLPETGTAAAQTFSWSQMLKQPRTPSLKEMYDLEPGIAHALMNIARFFARQVLRVVFWTRVRNFEKFLQHDGAILIAPNHQSYLDAVLLYCFMPKKRLEKTFFIALDEMFSQFPFSKMVNVCRIIKTASSQTTLSSLQYAAEALNNGFSVCIFPEGERSPDGSIVDPMMGAGILTCECGVPFAPVLVEGAMGSLSRTNPGLRFCRVKLTALDLVFPPKKEEYCEEDYREVTSRWKQTILEHMPEGGTA